MFVRFRQQGRRLQASLMETRRVAGRVRSEHVAALGTVGVDVSVRDRLDFWTAIEARLNRLGNRVGPEDRAKIIEALDARIPALTPDDLRSVQKDNATHDQKFWGDILAHRDETVELHRSLIAKAEKTIAETTSDSNEVAARVDVAKDRLARIGRGEAVVGGLGKPFDLAKILREAGFTASDTRHAIQVASLTPEEFASLTPMVVDSIHRSQRAAVRKVLRARRK